MMNQTVIVNEEYRDRRFTNMFNVLFRHCRIVNVKQKSAPQAPSLLQMPPMKASDAPPLWNQSTGNPIWNSGYSTCGTN